MVMTDSSKTRKEQTARSRMEAMLAAMRRAAFGQVGLGPGEGEEVLAAVARRAISSRVPDTNNPVGDRVADEGGGEGLKTHLLGTSMPTSVEDRTTSDVDARLGRYLPIEELGRGAMGRVLRAYDPKLEREVALKVLKAEAVDSLGWSRMVREARSMAQLNHRHVVAIYDVVEDPRHGLVIAMELVKGTTLKNWVEEQPRFWREVLKAFIEAGRGLAAAHAQGLLHRDFKPANALVALDDHRDTRGPVKVADFGLARRSREEATLVDPRRRPIEGLDGGGAGKTLTEAGTVVGTPVYMAPEQHRGDGLTSAADQYAFCVALWEAVYGERPFGGTNLAEISVNVLDGRRRPPPKGRVVPGRLRRACERGMSLDPGQRWPSMEALLTELRTLVAPRTRRRVALGLMAGLAALGGGLVMGLAPDRDVCTGAADRIDEVWDPTRKATIESAFVETNLPFAADAWTRVEGELDRRTSAWVEHHTEVCEATNVRREQSPALMDARMACLERRRSELRALVEVFQMPDRRVVEEAVERVQELEDSEACLTMLERSGAAIDDPMMRVQVDEVESMLAQSMARYLSERSPLAVEPAAQAVEPAAQALERARKVDHPPTLARAAIHHALIRADYVTDEDADEVRELLLEAIALVAETAQPDLEVEGWAKLMLFDGSTRGHPEAGLALRAPAQMALRRGGGVRAEAVLEQATGAVLHANQDHAAALEAQKRALEKWRAAVGEQHWSVTHALSNIGAEYAELGQPDEARRYLEEAATLVERLQGPYHPSLGAIRINLGGVLQLKGDLEGANAYFLAAAELLQRVLPPGHPHTLSAMLGLAQVEQQTDPARVEPRYEEVLSMILAQETPDLILLATTQNALGGLILDRSFEITDDPGEAERLHRKALRHFTAALETYERLPGDKRPARKLKLVEHNLCKLEHGRGRFPEALEHCANAWGHQQAEHGSIDTIGMEMLELYVDLHLQQGRRTEAIPLLHKAMAMGTPADSVDLRIRLADLLWKHDPLRRTDAVEMVSEAEVALRSGASAEQARDAFVELGDSEREEVEQWLAEHRAP